MINKIYDCDRPGWRYADTRGNNNYHSYLVNDRWVLCGCYPLINLRKSNKFIVPTLWASRYMHGRRTELTKWDIGYNE